MPGWNDLPIEMQEEVAKRLPRSSRNGLRLCSKSSKQLVKWTKLNSVARCVIKFPYWEGGSYTIKVVQHEHSSSFNDVQTYELESFEELQDMLPTVLKPIDCIGKLCIYGLQNFLHLTLLKNGTPLQKVRVESLVVIGSNGYQTAHLLSQLEPLYLKKVYLSSDEGNPNIYDMPQIILAEDLRVDYPSCIREDQLLKLSARKVDLNHPKLSLVTYVKKCAREAVSRFPEFIVRGLNAYFNLRRSFSWFSKRVLLETRNPNLKFQLSFDFKRAFVIGSIYFDSERTASLLSWCDQSLPRMIQELRVDFDSYKKYWVVSVARRTHANYKYKLKSIGHVQNKLDEILEHTDCIVALHLYLEKSDEDLLWKPRNKPLQISLLDLKGGSSTESIQSLLRVVDPSLVKKIDIVLNKQKTAILQMPHFYNASAVEISESVSANGLGFIMYDQQVHGIGVVENSNLEGSITGKVINQYIKNCLPTLTHKAHNFKFYGRRQNMVEEEIFEGFSITSRMTSEFWITCSIDLLDDSKFYLEVIFNIDIGLLVGSRKRKS